MKTPFSGMIQAVDDLWKKRLKLERWIREFFWSLDYEETRTPLLVRSPGMEPHIRPFLVKPGVFLPTSPEFGMKKLLARGLPRIFQICPAFRDEPFSPEHSPEFTLLEFYETGISLEHFQQRIEELFSVLAKKTEKEFQLPARPEFHQPWQKFRVNELFILHTGIDLRKSTPASLAEYCRKNQVLAEASESWDDLYFKIWLNFIEPRLPKDRPCMVTHYPLSQSSLCNPVRDAEGFEWANRFEIYYGNLELGNAFDELRDPEIQRANFLKDQKIRKETYGNTYPESPLDEELLAAIKKMPPACGIAIGLDRLAMLLLGARTIHEVIPLKTHWNQN